MKNKIIEINKLPHVFNYLEFVEFKKNKEKIKYFVSSEKYKTDFVEICRPEKKLVRFI